MDIFSPMFTLKIGSLVFPSAVVLQWAVMIFLIIVGLIVTRGLKVKAGKIQTLLEMFYETVTNLISGNMGEGYMSYVPFIGTLMMFLLILNTMGLIGFEEPTKNLNVSIALTIVVVLVIHGNAIRKNGIGGYLKGYISPHWAMFPLTLMERVIFPVALALRLFGNMLAAVIIISLAYQGLAHIAWAAQIGLPIIAHFYFDVFDGTIQMIIFTMLTIVNIKIVEKH
ncbi:MAG: F0F1 ATP synthase subunit A [Sarcina sp.]